MTAVHIILLSVAAALVCAMIRTQRPEIASMVSIAVGIGALLMTRQSISSVLSGIRRLLNLASAQSEGISIVLKAAGITILAEMGVQICTDAGERALAGRIQLACRIVMLGMAIPSVLQILESVLQFSG